MTRIMKKIALAAIILLVAWPAFVQGFRSYNKGWEMNENGTNRDDDEAALHRMTGAALMLYPIVAITAVVKVFAPRRKE